ncbi:MAG: PH domain-containing protein [Lachnospiraceae bacterium]|nr:PH domain-containing protein [Lachnospiraceae bacterium]MCI5588499.1 PH domain-containing protein [Lachnospiraceae bacterium]
MEDSKKIIWEERKRNCLGLPWTFTKYAFSEDRIFVKSGLLKTVENEVRLYRVMDLSLTRTLSQKIFGLGTIKVSSADKTLGNFEIINIRNSEEVKEQLSQLVEENRDRKRVSNREYMDDDDNILDDDD